MSSSQKTLLRRSYVSKIIGKAKVHGYIYYLIKWKDHLNLNISWQSAPITRKMTKLVLPFNEKTKEKTLPYIQKLFQQEGLQLLKSLVEKKKEQTQDIKIERIIGKCSLNNQPHYFIKWKDRSIFQSDWITKHDFWPFFNGEFKSFNKKVKNLSLPCLDKNAFEEYIKIERFAFLNDPRFESIQNFLHDKQLKKEKILDKIAKKQQHIKTESNEKSNEEIISDLISELREKFYRPIQNLYIPPERNKVKFQESSLDSTTQFFDSSQSQENEISLIDQLKRQTSKNQSMIKNNINELPSQQESEGNSSQSSEFDPSDMRLRTRSQTKKSKLKQSQIYPKSENHFSFKPLQKEQSKVESKKFSQDNSVKNCKQKSRNNLFGCQKIQQGDSTFPKSIFFEFNGQLSQTFTFDHHSLNKSCEPLNIFQQNSKNPKFESKKEKQSEFLTFMPDKHQESQKATSSTFQGDTLEISETINENQREKKVRKIVITQKKTQNFFQDEKQKSQVNQVEKTENKENKEKIISIRLFAEDISSLQSQQQKQNLYEVIFQKNLQIVSTIDSHQSQTKSQYNEKDIKEHSLKERRFLETSYLKKHYNNDFLHFLELQIGRLRKQQ